MSDESDKQEMQKYHTVLETTTFSLGYYFIPLCSNESIQQRYNKVCTIATQSHLPENANMTKTCQQNALFHFRIAEAQIMLRILTGKCASFYSERQEAIKALTSLVKLDTIISDFWKN